MNPDEYPPLTVAVVTFPGGRTERLAIKRGEGSGETRNQWFGVSIEDPGTHSGLSSRALTARPLLVLDDRTIEDLADSLGLGYPTVRRAVQRVLNRKYPPKPTVYEHIVTHTNGYVLTSLCGKVWQSSEDVVIEGRCPECTDRIANWRA